MYQTTIRGDKLYHSVSEGYGEPVELFGAVENGETPMSLLNIALASCVTMCVQGYFKRSQGIVQMDVAVDSSHEDEVFHLTVTLSEKVSERQEAEVLDYINQQCRVKKLLRTDVTINIELNYR
ncbi:OsmC family protein [Streptococcus sp. 20-1249]|uniref:OsmC family protein n=1 Tax=Streptococcus hepaticus TaxID=3349163 RepID=UPI003748E870